MFKKIFSIFLVCLMCFFLSIPAAFAACNVEPGLDTSLSCKNGQVEYIYLNGRPLTYQILKDNPEFSFKVHCVNTYSNRTLFYVGDLVACQVNDTATAAGYLLNASTVEGWSSFDSIDKDMPIGVSTQYNITYELKDFSGADSLVYSSPSIDLPSGFSGSDYALYYEGGYLYALLDFKPLQSSVESYNGEYRINYTIQEPADLYVYTNSGGWSLFSDNLTGSHSFTVVDSSSILYYPDKLTYEGEDFFTGPLTLEMAVQGGLVHLMATMMKAVLILVGLGLSLMASLICLELLKRLFFQFLN